MARRAWLPAVEENLTKKVPSFLMEDKEYLFRYQPLGKGFRCENLKRLILKNELAFGSPLKLNDPFDCKTLYSLESAKDKDAQIRFSINRERYNNRTRNLGKSDSEIIDIVNKNFDHTLIEDDIELKKQRDKGINNIEEVLEEFFIASFCMADEPNNILLWSHYADGHKGCCLQFDNLHENHTGMWHLKVDYDAHNKFPSYSKFVDVLDKGKVDLAEHVLGVKAKEWKYENELRIMVPDEGGQRKDVSFREIPEKSLLSITLGCEMTEKNKTYIKNRVKERTSPIKIYQAVKKDNEYGIKLEEVSID